LDGPFSAAVPSVSDGLIGLACLATVVVMAIGRRRGSDGPSPRLAAGLGLLLALCGSVELTRAITARPDRIAAAPVLSGAACCAAALTLRKRRAGSPAAAEPAGAPGRREAPRVETADAPTSIEEPTSSGPEVERLVEALRQSEARVRELTETDARKNEFLAVLGHELRNPLAPIRNALRIMKHRGADDPDHVWARDVVEHQLIQLKQLVDDLLEVSRVNSGKLRLDREPVDLATIVAFAVETSRPTIDAHRHRLSIALPAKPMTIEADPIRLAQVLANLLNNAAKYTEDGGQIRLTVGREGDRVVLRVKDNGVGIPGELLPRVFDLFAQADQSLDRSQGGLGLGLTLVRSLVELHGGSVEARSEGPGQGSEFIVRLPAMTEARAKSEPVTKTGDPPAAPAEKPARRPRPVRTVVEDARSAPSPGRDGARRRVLVVDDTDSSAQSMAMILKLEGYEVQIAYDGETALELIRTFRPEAILSDIVLPGLDGHELARRIRRDSDLSAGVALLAAVTGQGEPEARRRSREAGFDRHLVKPVDPDSVLALLASLEWREQHVALETSWGG
jgi:signal transduction histidine kinase/ActR/RegA family two-component response regulator